MRFGYIGVAVSDDHIFALYSGRLANRAQFANYGGFVHVYDEAGRRQDIVALDAPALAIAATDRGDLVTLTGGREREIQLVPTRQLAMPTAMRAHGGGDGK